MKISYGRKALIGMVMLTAVAASGCADYTRKQYQQIKNHFHQTPIVQYEPIEEKKHEESDDLQRPTFFTIHDVVRETKKEEKPRLLQLEDVFNPPEEKEDKKKAKIDDRAWMIWTPKPITIDTERFQNNLNYQFSKDHDIQLLLDNYKLLGPLLNDPVFQYDFMKQQEDAFDASDVGKLFGKALWDTLRDKNRSPKQEPFSLIDKQYWSPGELDMNWAMKSNFFQLRRKNGNMQEIGIKGYARPKSDLEESYGKIRAYWEFEFEKNAFQAAFDVYQTLEGESWQEIKFEALRRPNKDLSYGVKFFYETPNNDHPDGSGGVLLGLTLNF